MRQAHDCYQMLMVADRSVPVLMTLSDLERSLNIFQAISLIMLVLFDLE